MKLELHMNKEFRVNVEVDPEMKLQLISDFSKINNTFEPFFKWMENPNVNNKEKEPYRGNLTNALNSMNFAYQLLLLCGITPEEIKEAAKLPF